MLYDNQEYLEFISAVNNIFPELSSVFLPLYRRVGYCSSPIPQELAQLIKEGIKRSNDLHLQLMKVFQDIYGVSVDDIIRGEKNKD
ncbi:MAG: hypothetical protein ISS48_03885 [Candidatus Aenigmarchaeota archaeon]|nr:hypothetical protein [Candidatus Aenigmarchaeota archaeon]